MKVLYDSQIFDRQRYGGISRCFVENYKHFSTDIKAKFAILETDNHYLQELGFPPMGTARAKFITKKDFPFKRTIFRWYNRLTGGIYFGYEENALYSCLLLEKGNYDIFHPTYYDDYFLKYIGNKPFVLTIHDMIPERFPQYYSPNDFQIKMKKRLAPLASKIIAVSENTKKDIIDILKVPENKIEVVYHGCSLKTKTGSSQRLFPFSYILYVGERYNYKNFMWMCEELLPILKMKKDLHIVCTGKAFTEEELTWQRVNQVEERFRIISVDDSQLYDLYHYAEVFIYPSEYEGFGIPILEAFASDCPVLLNRASCFPEIAGKAAQYFTKRENKSDLSEVVLEMLEMQNSRKQHMLSIQRERLKQYSWEKSAQHIENIYYSVV